MNSGVELLVGEESGGVQVLSPDESWFGVESW